MTTNQDLLDMLLVMKDQHPERMGDALFAWDENQVYTKVGFHLLEEDYINADQEGYVPYSQHLASTDFTEEELGELEELKEITELPKGTLVITLD